MPSSETIWWFPTVVFVHATVSPAATVTCAGVNAPGTIFTVVVAAELDAGNASTSPAATRIKKRLTLTPPCLFLPFGCDLLVAVSDPDRVAPRVEIARARLVGGHVHAIRERALPMGSREDPARELAELQLLHRHPLPERRAALHVNRTTRERPRAGDLREQPSGARPGQRQLRAHLDGDRLALRRL